MQVDEDELGVSAFDELEEPPSLVAFKAAVAARMPLVDLPEMLLEMHARTGFANGFTHASESGAPAGGVATSLCALLLAEACNTGFEPLIRRDNAARRRSRLSWCGRTTFGPRRSPDQTPSWSQLKTASCLPGPWAAAK